MENNQNQEQNNEQNQEQNNEQNQAPQIDYSKLEETLNKITSKKEKSVLKSLLEQEGLTEDEIPAALASFAASKKTKEEEAKNEFDNIKKENEILKNKLLQNDIRNTASKIAESLNINGANLDDVLKLSDSSAFTDKDGKIQETEIKKQFEDILKRIPAFKKNQTQGIHFGTGSQNGNPASNSNDDLKKLFGIK